MQEFKKVFKGYDCKQVEDYIKSLSLRNQNKTSEFKSRIDELKQEIAKLKYTVKTFKDNESTVNKAILLASETANEYEKALKANYKMELVRLNTFRSTWEEYVNKQVGEIKKIDEKSSMECYIMKAEKRLKKELEIGLNIKDIRIKTSPERQFLEEQERLDDFNDVPNNNISDAEIKRILEDNLRDEFLKDGFIKADNNEVAKVTEKPKSYPRASLKTKKTTPEVKPKTKKAKIKNSNDLGNIEKSVKSSELELESLIDKF